MKTFFQLLLVVGMITLNANVTAQVVVTSNFIIDASVFFEPSRHDTVNTVVDNTVGSHTAYAFDQTGQIYEASFPAMPGSENPYTGIKAVKSNYAIVFDYSTDAYGNAYGIHHRNAGTDTWTRVRSLKSFAGHRMVLAGSDLVFTAKVGPDARLGNTLVGETYGGNHGDDGADFIALPASTKTVLCRIDSTGALMQSEFVLSTGSVIDMKIIPSGLLLKVIDGADFHFTLLDVDTFDEIWTSPVYAGIEDASINEDPSNGNLIISIDDAPYISKTYVYESDKTTLIAETDFAGIVNLISNDLYLSSDHIRGYEKLDARYSLIQTELAGYTYKENIFDFDGVSLTACSFTTYTGSGNTIGATELIDVPVGKIGVAYISYSLIPTGEQLLVNDGGDPYITDVFNFAQRTADDTMLLEDSENHESFLIFDDLANIPVDGTDMSGYVTVPAGWTLYPIEMKSDDDGSYFVIQGHNGATELLFNKVFCTADPLAYPVVNTAPEILGSVDMGACLVMSNREYLFHADDAEDDEIEWFLGDDAPEGLSFIENALFVNIANIGDVEFTVYATDGTDTVSADRMITINDDLGAEDLELQNAKIFFNPTFGTLNVDGVNPDRIELFNLRGQKVFMTSETISDVNHLPAAVYIVLVTKNNATQTVKIVKQ